MLVQQCLVQISNELVYAGSFNASEIQMANVFYLPLSHIAKSCSCSQSTTHNQWCNCVSFIGSELQMENAFYLSLSRVTKNGYKVCLCNI